MTTRRDEISDAFQLSCKDLKIGRCDECGYFPLATLESVWEKAAEWADENPCNSLFDDYAESYLKLEMKYDKLRQQLAIAKEALDKINKLYVDFELGEMSSEARIATIALAQISEVGG